MLIIIKEMFNKNLKEPFVIILVGPPLAGKSTWVKKNLENVEVISRDDIIMQISESDNYNESFKTVDQKNVDKLLREKIEKSNKDKLNVVIDMTNVSAKRRKSHLKFFSDEYYKLAVIFEFLKESEYIERNNKRKLEEKKDISIGIVKQMIENYQVVNKDEGFDKIIYL